MYTRVLIMIGFLVAASLQTVFAMDREKEPEGARKAFKRFITKPTEEEWDQSHSNDPIEKCLLTLAQIRDKGRPPAPELTLEELAKKPAYTLGELAQRYGCASLESPKGQQNSSKFAIFSSKKESPKHERTSPSPRSSLLHQSPLPKQKGINEKKDLPPLILKSPVVTVSSTPTTAEIPPLCVGK